MTQTRRFYRQSTARRTSTPIRKPVVRILRVTCRPETPADEGRHNTDYIARLIRCNGPYQLRKTNQRPSPRSSISQATARGL
jgi:hypothetical protein